MVVAIGDIDATEEHCPDGKNIFGEEEEETGDDEELFPVGREKEGCNNGVPVGLADGGEEGLPNIDINCW